MRDLLALPFLILGATLELIGRMIASPSFINDIDERLRKANQMTRRTTVGVTRCIPWIGPDGDLSLQEVDFDVTVEICDDEMYWGEVVAYCPASEYKFVVNPNGYCPSDLFDAKHVEELARENIAKHKSMPVV